METAAAVIASEPHVLAGIDDDVVADLHAIGIDLTPDIENTLDNARREAMAAWCLKRAQRLLAEIHERAAARELEIQMVDAHYKREIDPLAGRYEYLIKFVEHLAELSIAPDAKKKSRATPWGTYGVRDSAPTVERSDPQALLNWAVANRHECVRAIATLPYAEALEYFTEAELQAKAKVEVQWGELKKTLDAEGELPPGVVKVPAARTPYAKLDASAGTSNKEARR